MSLDRFSQKHRDATRPLGDWLNIVRRATWKNLAELRRIFPSADGVNVRVAGGDVVVVTVFNIKGNRYRLLAVVNYPSAVCRVVDVLTHAEYSTDKWKDRI
jgi:mRNA interferase HigB